ncbi:hypothetical protein P7L78_13870 [Tistrella bauzanensis]|uniref:Pectate lyase superfamily protein domain-containing protein n=1 Tax=Tistrella arctica TaxID=3133430 RepID=A0ABU9YHL0_9PROT
MSIEPYYEAPFDNAVARSVSDKLADFVTPNDFGAIGDNTTDDTVALQRALDSGRHVMIVGRHVISAPLQVTTSGQRIFGATGAGYMAYASIRFPTSDDTQAVFHVRSSGVVFDGLVIRGNPGNTAGWSQDLEVTGSMIISANQDPAYSSTGQNNGDVDLTITNCSLGNAKTLVKVTGRGVRISDCNLVLAVHVLEIDWPTDFTVGTAYDSALKSGMRSYVLRDNRIHGCSGGYVVRNIGLQKENLQGLMVIGNFIDTNIRMFRGVANDSLFSDNVMIHVKAAGTVFSVEGGDSIQIASNTIYGMDDNGLNPAEKETHREIVSGISLSNATNVSITGNQFKRVLRDVLVVATGVRNVSFCRNVMTNIGIDNGDATVSPFVSRFGVRIVGSLDGLIAEGNIVDTPVRSIANPPFVGVVSGGSLSNWIIQNNILPTQMAAHDLSTSMRADVVDTSRAVTAYDGDGVTSQSITLRFAPVAVLVTIATGTNRGRTMAVSAMSGAGADLVEISGRTVIVKGDWNVSGTTYTLIALT